MLALATLTHVVYRLHSRSHENGFDYAKTPTETGRLVTSFVKEFGTEGLQELSSVQDGYCRYVVIASSTCSFSKEQAVKWTVIASLEPERPLVPEGWKAFWVFIDPGEIASEFKDPGFPVRRFMASNNSRFMKEVGVISFPYHLVLDPNGVVVSAGIGGRLPPRESFRGDCALMIGNQ